MNNAVPWELRPDWFGVERGAWAVSPRRETGAKLLRGMGDAEIMGSIAASYRETSETRTVDAFLFYSEVWLWRQFIRSRQINSGGTLGSSDECV